MATIIFSAILQMPAPRATPDPDAKHEHERGRREKDKDLITQAKHRATEYGDNCQCEHTTSPPVMTGASTLSPDDIKLFERRLVPGTLREPQRAAVIVPNVKGARPFPLQTAPVRLPSLLVLLSLPNAVAPPG